MQDSGYGSMDVMSSKCGVILSRGCPGVMGFCYGKRQKREKRQKLAWKR